MCMLGGLVANEEKFWGIRNERACASIHAKTIEYTQLMTGKVKCVFLVHIQVYIRILLAYTHPLTRVHVHTTTHMQMHKEGHRRRTSTSSRFAGVQQVRCASDSVAGTSHGVRYIARASRRSTFLSPCKLLASYSGRCDRPWLAANS